MRSIAIIGAGQAGLPLAIALKQLGYRVTLFSNRTAEQMRKGRMMTSPIMFHKALQFERKWNLNPWDKEFVQANNAALILGVPGEAKKGLEIKGKFEHIFQSIDQRLKFSYWLNEYQKIGGNLVIQDVGLNELNTIAKEHELTIVAGGRGDLGNYFPRDKKRSMFDKPMRTLTQFLVNGMISDELDPSARLNFIPGVGEYFYVSTLSHSGLCKTIVIEGIPGGPFDCFNGITDPQEQLETGVKLLKQFIPWEAEKCEKLELIDSQATLTGRITPTVREPVAIMPCGKPVLGMADTVVLNDPIAGQGANNAAKCAEIYLQSILEQANKPFDNDWMCNTFYRFWDQTGEISTKLTNAQLMPPQPHKIELFQAASTNSLLAEKFVRGFEEPHSLLPWFFDPEAARNLIKQLEVKQYTGSIESREFRDFQ